LPGEEGDAAGTAGPTRQEGRSVIVFDDGAVLRISNPLPAGQKIILSNQQGREVVCRVVGGRNLPNVKGYIEVQFLEQVNDFWHIHQTPQAPQSVSAPASPFTAAPATPLPQPAHDMAASAPPATQPTPVQANALDPASSGAPTFEDVAGLVQMSPKTPIRDRKTERTVSVDVPKSKSETAQHTVEQVKPAAWNKSAPPPLELTSDISTAAPQQESLSPQIRSEAVSKDVFGKSAYASVLSSSDSSPAESRGRMPLILGGVALLLAGFGGGYFFMHRGNTPAQTSTAVVASNSSAPAPAEARNGIEAPSVSRPAVERAPAQAAEPVPAVSSGPVVSASAEAPDSASARPRVVINAESKQPDRTVTHRPVIPNLKMTSPTAPNKNIANLSDGASSSSAEVALTEAPGTVSSRTFGAREENQPAPPPAAIPAVVSTKATRDAKLISSTRPVYPAIAKESRVQGSVVVTADINDKGSVVAAKAVSGPMFLRQAAVDAVKQWKYSPAQVDDRPAPTQVSVTLDFHLN